jgi:predicted GNAT family acetyltransferase
MTFTTKLHEAPAVITQLSSINDGSLTIQPLTGADEREALAFLSPRSFQTFYMTSLIRENGLESPFNRGTFYGCRSMEGQLEGAALIGHSTLIETHSEPALEAFARIAQDHPFTHMIAGEPEKVERFWQYYAKAGQASRRVCRNLLFEQQRPVQAGKVISGLRQATLDDLNAIAAVHARMLHEERGVNPLAIDPAGFRQRYARRIEQGRVWAWIKQERVIFKADIMASTPEVIYLEGVYVDPAERGQGYGSRCMLQLSRHLLALARSIYLLVSEQNKMTQAFYQKIGYKQEGYYDTIYVERDN